jgi:hypothetical protein
LLSPAKNPTNTSSYFISVQKCGLDIVKYLSISRKRPCFIARLSASQKHSMFALELAGWLLQS